MGSRLIKITLQMQKTIDIISAYAPHAERPVEEKAEFYQQLQKLTDERPRGNDLIIMGDMNARMIQAEDEEEADVIGKATIRGNIETVNDLSANTEATRSKMISFCLYNGMKLTNTFFE